MSDTPKTDAQTHDPIEYDSMGGWSWSPYNIKPQPDGDWVPADFARELERENAALQEQLLQKTKQLEAENAELRSENAALKIERNRYRVVLQDIADAAGFDNIGNWARNKARATLEKEAQP